ncbi:hypothetical protein ACJX0J_010769, partial [Zea mays]
DVLVFQDFSMTSMCFGKYLASTHIEHYKEGEHQFSKMIESLIMDRLGTRPEDRTTQTQIKIHLQGSSLRA